MSGERIRTFDGVPAASSEFFFDDGRVIAALSSDDGRTRLATIDVESGEREWWDDTNTLHRILSVEASVGLLACEAALGWLDIWDIASRRRIASINAFEDSVTGCVFLRGGTLALATGFGYPEGSDGPGERHLRIWEVARAADQLSSIDPGIFYESVRHRLREDAVVTTSRSGLCVWDIDLKTRRRLLKTDSSSRCTALVAGGTALLDATDDRRLSRWNLETGDREWTIDIPSEIDALTVDAEGRRAYLGLRSGFVRSVDLAKPVSPVEAKAVEIRQVTITKDGTVWTSNGAEIVAWNLDTNRPMTRLAAGDPAAPSFSITEADGAPPIKILGGHGSVSSRAWGPSRRWLAFGTVTGRVGIVDPSGKDLRELSAEEAFSSTSNRVHALAVHPTRSLLAAAYGHDASVRLWNAETWQEVALDGKGFRAFAVCFSPDGKWLLSGHGDGIARLWDVSSV